MHGRFLIRLTTSLGALALLNGPAVAGSAITAMLDTGINGGTLTSVRVPGFDFVDNDADPTDHDDDEHGTQQARIFNNHAPTSRIMPLRTYSGNGDAGRMLLTRGQAAIDFALRNPDVKIITLNRLQPVDVGRLQTAANRDVVVLINAGNQGQGNPQGSATLIPQLGGRGLIVGGHRSDGTIAGESNRPGPSFAEHTITALYTSPFSSIDGTSFALPRVAAAASRVKRRDPHLTPLQVVEILKRTAIDAGSPGVDAVYGHGLLNATAAFEAVGKIEVPDGGGGGGGGSSSSSGAAAAGALVVGGGLYALFKRNERLKRTLILDEFGRSFWLDMTVAAPRRDRSPTLNLVMADLEREQRVVPLSQTADMQSYAVIKANADDFRAQFDVDDGDYRGAENVSYSFHSVHRAGREMAFSLNDSQRDQFGALSLLDAGAAKVDFVGGDALGAPFMGFTEEGLSSAFKFNAGDNVSVKFGLSANDEERRWGLESDSAFFETSYETPRFGIAVQIGELHEDGSLFGGASDGPFSVDAARTLSLGLSGRYNLAPNTALIGSYTIGMTDVKHKDPSLLRNFSTVKSDSYGAGIVSFDVLRRGDALGVGVFQPLRVTGGEVDSTVPYARDIEGNIFSNTDRYSLVPDGAERNYELYYSMDVGRNVRFGSHFMYRDQPLHDADADRERVVMFTLDRDF